MFKINTNEAYSFLSYFVFNLVILTFPLNTGLKLGAGISAAMATTAIPSKNSNKLSVGFGIASYRGQAAGAVGSIFTISPHIQIKVAMTYDTQSGTGLNSGITIGF
ncbi:YadA C-terminal domain-containing protein [Xenorhabdus miraniensis]|uniref:YadA C-terminal domain-containing protein n=1 Tax=Xenorhabdus miraniensis TaxID=351674 RepID=UPI0011AB4E2C|nr:YadA C-terminal domain-containing protein [Xenorhabdus miraniensis]